MKYLIIFVVLLTVLSVSVLAENWTLSDSDITISDYDQKFVQDGKFNGILPFSSTTGPDYIVAATDIGWGLGRQYSGVSIVGNAKLTTEMSPQDYNNNMILVGGMCVNLLTATIYDQLFEVHNSCVSEDTIGMAHIRIKKNGGYYLLFVHGYTADDTKLGSRVLSNWKNYQNELNYTSVCVTGSINEWPQSVKIVPC